MYLNNNCPLYRNTEHNTLSINYDKNGNDKSFQISMLKPHFDFNFICIYKFQYGEFKNRAHDVRLLNNSFADLFYSE